MNTSHSLLQPLVFTVRVYGILLDNKNRILVSDEFIRGNYFTKFPGGGLEFGEGTRDCLKREFMEETGLDVTVGAHIYTTDIFQMSAFNSKHQIIAVYYYVHSNVDTDIEVKTTKFDFAPEAINNPNGQAEVRRWIPLETITPADVDLPLDKIVVSIIAPK
jgi:8-oxo-dGTP diphosphatase